jgi:hypothetical protein
MDTLLEIADWSFDFNWVEAGWAYLKAARGD